MAGTSVPMVTAWERRALNCRLGLVSADDVRHTVRIMRGKGATVTRSFERSADERVALAVGAHRDRYTCSLPSLRGLLTAAAKSRTSERNPPYTSLPLGPPSRFSCPVTPRVP